MSSKPIFLDVDSSIREKNYMIAQRPEEEEIGRFLNAPILPPKLVKPTPGFCIKTKEKLTNKKVFINVCQTDAIPPPKDITEQELQNILQTDEITDYRIPMSIGDLQTTIDKKNEPASVCDIAIHPSFLALLQTSLIFKEFFVAVAFESIKEKHKIDTEDEKIILMNKKVMGELQVHRIQQREIKEKMGGGDAESLPSVDDILGRKDEGKKKIMEVMTENESITPEHRLFRKPDDDRYLFAEIYLPYVVSSKDLTLDIGEDRIILESTKSKYFLDVFHDFYINEENSTCTFNTDTKFLTITMPIKNR